MLLTIILLLLQAKPTATIAGIVRYPNGAPAVGVRVFAVPSLDASRLESIAQTDDAGHYRVEVAPGRYFVGVGAVEEPFYFPGTGDLSAARSFSVTPKSSFEGVDFSAFVPVFVESTSALPPGSTGVLSGTVRYPDGAPAAGMVVTAVLTSAVDLLRRIGTPDDRTISCMESNLTLSPRGGDVVCVEPVRTDQQGRYRLTKVPPGTYYIVVNFVASPVFYRASPTSRSTEVTTLPTTNLDKLDINVPHSAMATISGRVLGIGNEPIVGATVRIRNTDPDGASRSVKAITAAGGYFAFASMPPGIYRAEARVAGASSELEVSVVGQSSKALLLSLPSVVLTGRVQWEGGREVFPNAEVLGNAFATKIDHGRIVETTIITIDKDGQFSAALSAGEYLFHLKRTTPNGYRITSMQSSDGVDLLKQTLKIGQAGSINVDVYISQ